MLWLTKHNDIHHILQTSQYIQIARIAHNLRMFKYVNFLFLIILRNSLQQETSRYGEVTFETPGLFETRPKGIGKVEREYRYPRTNLTRFYQFQKFENPIEKTKDELNFNYEHLETKTPNYSSSKKTTKLDRNTESHSDEVAEAKPNRYAASFETTKRSNVLDRKSDTIKIYDEPYRTPEIIKIFDDPFETSKKYNFNRNHDFNRYDPKRHDFDRYHPKRYVLDRNYPSRYDQHIDRKFETPKRFNPNEDTPKRFDFNEDTPKRFDFNENTPKRFDFNEDTPKRFDFNEDTPKRFDFNEDTPKRFGFNEDTPKRFDFNEDTPKRFDFNEDTPKRFGFNEDTPKRFDFNEDTPKRFDLNEDTPKRLDFNEDAPKRLDFNEETRYVKIPEIKLPPTEKSISYENTLDQYQNPEFVTSKNSKETPKTFGGFKQGLFSKINTAIRNQFTKIFRPEQENGDRKLGYVKNYTRFGTVEKVQEKNKRFLNIFTILQFENSRCQAQGSFLSYEGTCYHRNECAQLRGFSMGACAKGFGVCCVFRGGCGDTTNQNITYFECDNCIGTTQTTTTSPVSTSSQGPPIDPRLNLTALIEMFQGRQSTAASPCVYTVQKKDPNVKQIRLDFMDFDIRGPTNGTCLQDQLIISGQNTNNIIPTICGYNTGQHLYVDVSSVPGPIRISVLLMSTTPRRFRIKVSQIRSPCINFMNCLQYYTGVEGTVMSFNYDLSPTGLSTPQYFNNLNYAICIRKEPGYCSITYTNVQNGVEAPFDIRNVDARGVLLIPPNQAGAEIFNCPDDYIIVNGIRLCGGRLNDGMSIEDFTRNAAVTDRSAGPIVLPFRTNNNTVGRGFKLYYRQNTCT